MKTSIRSITLLLLLSAWLNNASAEFVGRDVCVTCHQSMDHTIMLSHDMSDEESCEMCHGDGAKHSDTEASSDIRTFHEKSFTAIESANESCLTCHGGDVDRHWPASSHQAAGVSCVACHSLQHPGEPYVTKSDMTQVCMSCHTDVRAKMMRPYSHPVREGLMECSDCHQSHEPAGESELQQVTVNDNCYTCHAEKRGPFLWEHEPVTEDCTTCHDPHGSLHPGALVRRAPHLCQQCHALDTHDSKINTHANMPFDFSPADHVQRAVYGRACMNCHPQSHGSNHPSGIYLMR